ncbi:MAG: FAD-dependent oxidoreductase [Balneolaceae bacterium]|nr:FAD-dependent oxidoreductase [Balneolaceae bacterium]MCH8548780.1 FAD-dependent oxidoreductase [Balneolaceae bacterium]
MRKKPQIIPSEKLKTVLITGAGHAALPLIKIGRQIREAGGQIIVLNDNRELIYSGTVPQFTGGFLDREQTSVDLKLLCERYGVTFIQGKATALNREDKTVETETGEIIPYHRLLVNLGAATKPAFSGETIYPVKPLTSLLNFREQLKNGDAESLLIAGGGAAGSELALNLSHPDSPYQPHITVVERSDRILSSFPKRLSSMVAERLKNRGVTLKIDTTVTKELIQQFDHTILSAGNRPQSLLLSHDLPTSSTGRIITDETLRVKNNPDIFAAGDMTDVDGKNYPQIGVHAVKQGLVIRENMLALLKGEPLSRYKPYPINPLILSDGPDSAFFIAGNLVLNGRAFAVLKYLLDMRWLERYTKKPNDRRSDLTLIRDGIRRSKS